MGNTISAAGLESHRLLLTTLAGAVELNYNEKFWDDLFSALASSPLAAADPEEVEEELLPFCRQLLVHNPITKNFQKLVLHTVELLESPYEGLSTVSVSNAVYLIQLMLKHVMETAAPSTLESLFDLTWLPNLQSQSSGPLNTRLLRVALVYIRNNPPSERTYLVLLELLKLLITCASTQLYMTETLTPADANPLLDVLMTQCQELASGTIQTLLHIFMDNPVLPPNCTLFVPTDPEDQSVMKMVQKAAASMLWLPMRTYNMLSRAPPEGEEVGPLADLAMMLLLLLCHFPGAANPLIHAYQEHQQPCANPYQQALSKLQDSGALDPEGGGPDREHAQVDYSSLFMAVCGRLVNERASVLLYTLMQQCRAFQEYCLVRSDVEELLLPLLRLLYNARKGPPNHRYMLQIIVLILTQDEAFAYSLHKVLVRSVPWYTQRMLINIPLGSLLYVVLLRTAAHSFSRIQDLYLPTNTLAALANLAPFVTNIHAAAAQLLLNLLHQLIRRHSRLQQLAALQPPPDPSGHSDFPPGLPGAHPGAELQIVSDFLRMTLEIVNSILTFNLHANPEMVYGLLHRQEVLAPLRGQQRFMELLGNLQTVTDFFNRRLDEARKKAVAPHSWDVKFVLELVQQAAQTWRPDRLKQFPELRFVYEEEAHPQDFFVPYVWSLVVSASQRKFIPWNQSSIVLFSPYQPPDDVDGMSDVSSALELGGETPRGFWGSSQGPMNQAEMHV